MAGTYVDDYGSAMAWDDAGNVISRDAGSTVWVDDPSPAPASWSVFASDAQDQARLSSGYPANGAPLDQNMAMLGVTRLIDTATRAFVSVKGSTPATYAGQNGQTYANGQRMAPPKPGGDMGLLLVAGALFLALG